MGNHHLLPGIDGRCLIYWTKHTTTGVKEERSLKRWSIKINIVDDLLKYVIGSCSEFLLSETNPAKFAFSELSYIITCRDF